MSFPKYQKDSYAKFSAEVRNFLFEIVTPLIAQQGELQMMSAPVGVKGSLMSIIEEANRNIAKLKTLRLDLVVDRNGTIEVKRYHHLPSYFDKLQELYKYCNGLNSVRKEPAFPPSSVKALGNALQEIRNLFKDEGFFIAWNKDALYGEKYQKKEYADFAVETRANFDNIMRKIFPQHEETLSATDSLKKLFPKQVEETGENSLAGALQTLLSCLPEEKALEESLMSGFIQQEDEDANSYSLARAPIEKYVSQIAQWYKSLAIEDSPHLAMVTLAEIKKLCKEINNEIKSQNEDLLIGRELMFSQESLAQFEKLLEKLQSSLWGKDPRKQSTLYRLFNEMFVLRNKFRAGIQNLPLYCCKVEELYRLCVSINSAAPAISRASKIPGAVPVFAEAMNPFAAGTSIYSTELLRELERVISSIEEQLAEDRILSKNWQENLLAELRAISVKAEGYEHLFAEMTQKLERLPGVRRLYQDAIRNARELERKASELEQAREKAAEELDAALREKDQLNATVIVLQEELEEKERVNQTLVLDLEGERELKKVLEEELEEKERVNQTLVQELGEERGLNRTLQEVLGEREKLHRTLQEELEEKRRMAQNPSDTSARQGGMASVNTSAQQGTLANNSGFFAPRNGVSRASEVSRLEFEAVNKLEAFMESDFKKPNGMRSSRKEAIKAMFTLFLEIPESDSQQRASLLHFIIDLGALYYTQIRTIFNSASYRQNFSAELLTRIGTWVDKSSTGLTDLQNVTNKASYTAEEIARQNYFKDKLTQHFSSQYPDLVLETNAQNSIPQQAESTLLKA